LSAFAGSVHGHTHERLVLERLARPLVLWCDGAHDAVENMRRDAALLARLEAQDEAVRVPVLRVFRFDPPGITLGHAQRPERELDLERCRADGVRWAVRPTGGRAIYHDQEWTFSLATALDDPTWGGSVAEAYSAVANLVTTALERLGVPDVSGARATGRRAGTAIDRPDAAGREASCFAATGRHEIVRGGRKLVGCAQRRTASAILHQGSLLLGEAHLRLADYLALPEERRARLREYLRGATAHAGDHLGSEPPLADFAAALAASLGPDVRRVDGAAGAFLLTLAKPPSYTSPRVQPGD
jgi:lipoate-protein ligase A